jgi:hypothetical protein
MFANVTLSVELCHWYVKAPEPVAATATVNDTASPALQIVWLVATVPAVTSLIVTVNVLEVAEQVTEFSVLVTTLLK